MKYYYIPCQQRSALACFYDNDAFIYLCDRDRHANFFIFDFHRSYNGLGYNYCENNGQCYQDDAAECYYDNRCQFTSTRFGLSLDAILGYSIWPKISFSRQRVVVKYQSLLSIIFFARIVYVWIYS